MSNNRLQELLTALERVRAERKAQARRQAVQSFQRLLDRTADCSEADRLSMQEMLAELDVTSRH